MVTLHVIGLHTGFRYSNSSGYNAERGTKEHQAE